MTIGEALREARENVALSIEDLAERTSIRSGLIKEMEKNNFQNCGGDTYARGHIRNIAAILKVRPDDFIEMYNQEHSTQRRGIHDLLVESSVTRISSEQKKITWKSLVILSIVGLISVGIGSVIVSNSQTVAPIPKIPTASSATPSATPVVTPSTSPSVITDGITGEITLVITAARGNANIDVVDRGNHLYKGPIFQGDVKTFSAPGSISIYLSNAGDLDLTLNGVKLEPLGASGEEVRKTFRSDS